MGIITSAFQLEEINSKGTRVSCVYYQKKGSYEKSLETYFMILVDCRYSQLNSDSFIKTFEKSSYFFYDYQRSKPVNQD